MQELVRHIWGVELSWAQRIAGVAVVDRRGHARRDRWKRSTGYI